MQQRRLIYFVGIFVAVVVLTQTFSIHRTQAATFTVTNINDSGAGSLRQAILSANANAGLNQTA